MVRRFELHHFMQNVLTPPARSTNAKHLAVRKKKAVVAATQQTGNGPPRQSRQMMSEPQRSGRYPPGLVSRRRIVATLLYSRFSRRGGFSLRSRHRFLSRSRRLFGTSSKTKRHRPEGDRQSENSCHSSTFLAQNCLFPPV